MIYEITAAGGNGAIIEKDTVYKNLAKRGKELLKLSATAEQAGFVRGKKFTMAGGEFCGNGSRAAAIVLADFKSGEVEYSVSGFRNTVIAQVTKLSATRFRVSAKFSGFKYKINEKSGYKVVALGGITHIVIKGLVPKNVRQLLPKFIRENSLENAPAVGLIYLNNDQITPLVYVKKVNTVYDETACGSGAIAAFLAYGVKKVIQPTGQPIYVSKVKDTIILSSEMEVVDRKSAVYDALFEQVLSYDDVNKQKIVENGEEMARLGVDFVGVRAEAEPIARKTVVEMLNKAEKCLPKGLKLQVVDSYRPLAAQRANFDIEMAKVADKIPNELERKRFVHKYAIAAPECAGHPTGGAVDVQIVKNGRPLDFGTKMRTFCPDTMTFSPFVSKTAQNNRVLLRKVMTDVGFAPFNGEWWHFSYGDQEWAAYYGRKNAIYKQL